MNAVLSEVVERGLAVLKQVWDDSTPGEKAVLAAMTAAMGKRSHPIGLAEIDRAWANLDVMIPENEKVRAMRSLIARDVIIGEDKYQFAIELQRLWIQKYEKLEWVKEEIASALRVWQPPETVIEKRQLQRRARSDVLAVTIILGFFAALIIMLFLGLRSLNESVGIERAQRRTLEAQITRIAEAVATGTAAAEAPAATATAGAAQLQAEHLTSTAVAVECALSATAVDDFLSRLNDLRQQAGAAPLALSEHALRSGGPAECRSGSRRSTGIRPQYGGLCRAAARTTSGKALSTDPQMSPGADIHGLFAGGRGHHTRRIEHPGAQVWRTRTDCHADAHPHVCADEYTAPHSANAYRQHRCHTWGPLDLDWVIESQGRNPANPNQWLVVVNLIARGGDGQYTYYHDGLPVNGTRVQIVDQTCRNKPGSFWVQDGTGQIVKKSYYLFAPYCPGAKP